MPTASVSHAFETVHQRGQAAQQFDVYYDNLCALQNSVPLPNVKAHLEQFTLDICADKIRLNDWLPILKSLAINKSLKRVSIRSYFVPSEEKQQDVGDGGFSRKLTGPQKSKMPCIHSRDLTYQLCRAIRDCLVITDSLESLTLVGLPLRARDLTTLTKGIAKNFTLKELSLANCHVGETICTLCEGIKNASTLTSINLSGCSLADGAVDCIAKIIKHQSVMRHSEAWKGSLRYRAPDLDCMPGLRRITLNRNPLLGDSAALSLAEALKDDLWLKAVDMQECGLTDRGAEALLDALRLNSTLLVLDIRGNHLVSRSLIEKIIQQVMINSEGKITQYDWLSENSAEKRIAQAKQRKKVQTSKKLGVVSPVHKRSVSSPSLTPSTVPKQRGFPWRTAERAATHRLMEGSTAVPRPRSAQAMHLHLSCESVSESTCSLPSQDGGHGSQVELRPVNVKELQAENISLKRRLAEESAARAAAEDHALEMARENRRLQSEMRRQSLAGLPGVDEELLTQIEQAFSKFNHFLDLIRDFGLEHLIDAAGLNGVHTSSPLLHERNSNLDFSMVITSDTSAEMHGALPSGDIISHAASRDILKTYSENLLSADGSMPSSIQNTPENSKKAHRKHHRERPHKTKPKAKSKKEDTIPSDRFTAVLKDVSELDSPKLTPRASDVAAVSMNMRSAESEAPSSLLHEGKENLDPVSEASSQLHQATSKGDQEASLDYSVEFHNDSTGLDSRMDDKRLLEIEAAAMSTQSPSPYIGDSSSAVGVMDLRESAEVRDSYSHDFSDDDNDDD